MPKVTIATDQGEVVETYTVSLNEMGTPYARADVLEAIAEALERATRIQEGATYAKDIRPGDVLGFGSDVPEGLILKRVDAVEDVGGSKDDVRVHADDRTYIVRKRAAVVFEARGVDR